MSNLQSLAVPTEFKLGKAPWNISKISNEHLLSTTSDGMLKMKYNVGKDGHDSGAQIFCNPYALLPTDEVTVAYDVFFSEDWDFVICGKLPGIGFGIKEGDHASGGEWDLEGKAGSFRIMWQDGTPTSAILKGYLYLGIPGGPKKAYAPQGPHFKAVGNDDDRTGYSVYYKKQPCFKVKKGTWNTISFTVRMNTVGKADGYLRMQVNDTVREIDDIVWRTDERTKIQDLYWVSIFGGEGKKFAPHNPNAYSLYKNIRIGVASNNSPQKGSAFMTWAEEALTRIPIIEADPLMHAIETIQLPPGPVIEFGVWKGGDLRKMARRLTDRTLYGFDAFEDFKGKIPFEPLKNTKVLAGDIAQTLPTFIDKHKTEKVALLHIVDAASVLKDLNKANMLQDGTVLVFDRAFEHPGWERHDMNTFYDFLKATPWKVQWIGKQKGGQGVVCILKRQSQKVVKDLLDNPVA